MSPRARLVAALVAAAAVIPLAACAPAQSAPTASHRPTTSASGGAVASATPQLVGTTRTVLSPLGLNFHSAPALTPGNVIGDAAQGTSLVVLDYRADNGGWFKVMGQTISGWIVADPTLTAAGTFNPYSDSNNVGALFPGDWSFMQGSYGTVFLPQHGSQSIVLQTAANLAAFGRPGLPGYTQSSSQQEIVCGYTGSLDEYVKGGASSATAAALPVPRLALYAEIRLTFDATHAMLVGFNYQSSSQLTDFQNFYNSVTFPYPLCEAASTPAP